MSERNTVVSVVSVNRWSSRRTKGNGSNRRNGRRGTEGTEGTRCKEDSTCSIIDNDADDAIANTDAEIAEGSEGMERKEDEDHFDPNTNAHADAEADTVAFP